MVFIILLILALASPSGAWTFPPITGIIFNPIEEPGYPSNNPPARDVPYIATCFTNCMPIKGAEFVQAECKVRLPNPKTGAGADCATFCRYHQDDPWLQPQVDGYPNGAYDRNGGSMCGVTESANCNVYVFDQTHLLTDGGCDAAPASVMAHLK